MMRSVLQRIANRLPEPRVIYDRAGLSPYLERYYLIGRERPTVEHPEREGIGAGVLVRGELPGGYTSMLHHFRRGDDDVELHSHPHEVAYALILSGGYVEERRLNDECRCRHGIDRHRNKNVPSRWGGLIVPMVGAGSCHMCDCAAFRHRVVRRFLRPGMVNVIRATDYHRVELLGEDSWSLYLAGPKTPRSTWYFWNRDTGEETHWREFISRKRDPEAFARGAS